MGVVKNFLGADHEVPMDRLYHKAHFWLRGVGPAGGSEVLEAGVTGPGVALTGGLVELDVLAEPGTDLAVDEEVACATTKKAIKYFMSPLAGAVTSANTAATSDAAAAAAKAGKGSPTCKSIYGGIKEG